MFYMSEGSHCYYLPGRCMHVRLQRLKPEEGIPTAGTILTGRSPVPLPGGRQPMNALPTQATAVPVYPAYAFSTLRPLLPFSHLRLLPRLCL